MTITREQILALAPGEKIEAGDVTIFRGRILEGELQRPASKENLLYVTRKYLEADMRHVFPREYAEDMLPDPYTMFCEEIDEVAREAGYHRVNGEKV